jgi:hypothetical protein
MVEGLTVGATVKKENGEWVAEVKQFGLTAIGETG